MNYLRRFSRIVTPVTLAVLVAALTWPAANFARAPSIAEKAPNVVVVEMEISRGGEVLASPKMTVLFGKPARYTFVRSDDQEGSIRVQVLATKAAPLANGVATVKVETMVLEQIAGAWVVAGEPSMRVAEGKPGDMSIVGNLGQIDISLKATPKFSEKVVSFNPKVCGPIDGPVRAFGGTCPHCPQLPCPGCEDCCSYVCPDGSGQGRCCGAIECCDCGGCCSP